MAEVKTLPIPPALYDFVLFWECAKKDWLNFSKKSSIIGDGSLLNYIDWNSTYSFDPNDKGGKTLFGVTESTWQSYVKKYPNKGYSKNLNSMGKQGWLDQIEWFWNVNSAAGKCANYACAFIMFQMVWIGFSSSAKKMTLNTLKKNADIKDYSFTTSKNTYEQIADATHAYKDPMIAYDYMRKVNASYYYNISTPDKNNKKYRSGWLSRSVLSFLPDGLYTATTFSYNQVGLKYESTLDDWYNTAIQLSQENKRGFVKIMDWGVSPETLDKISSNTFGFTPLDNTYAFNSSNPSIGAYNGCGGVSQLGNYTNTPNGDIILQKNQSREDVLNTLIKGSYTPNDVKKCSELITIDKKKEIKTKSEK